MEDPPPYLFPDFFNSGLLAFVPAKKSLILIEVDENEGKTVDLP
jgi:hypothetical protein